jgi:hypothetical protein
MSKKRDFVMFNLKVRPDLHEEFKVAASLDGLDMSNMVRQFMIRTVREAKSRDAAKFEEILTQERAKDAEQSYTIQETTKGQTYDTAYLAQRLGVTEQAIILAEEEDPALFKRMREVADENEPLNGIKHRR